MTIDLCGKPLPNAQTCHELRRLVLTPDGTSSSLCLRCAWREAGRCWQCGAARTNDPILGMYCDGCAKARKYAVNKRWHTANADRVLAYHRQRWADGTVKRLREAAKARRTAAQQGRTR